MDTNTGSAGRAPETDPWWRSAVIYQIYPRSFADSNGDGIGDMRGISDRLGYIAELGADAVWLSPFYPSPMVDAGYDVADHRGVDPIFGTLADFDRVLATAHDRGLRVIIDIVPNHASSAHPWFIDALAAEPGSPARDRFMFRDGSGPAGNRPPNDWESIFGGPAWTQIHDGQWYLHLFDPAQPDFNWRNVEVRAEFESILRFWLDRGVDGFRIDVAHGLTKAPGLPNAGHAHQRELRDTLALPYFDRDDVHEIYRDWRKLIDTFPGDRMFVAETWAPSADRLARYVRPDELHQAFNFEYLKAPWSAAVLRSVIDESMSAMAAVGAAPTWVLSNHDKQRHLTRYGGGAVGADRARAALLLMLALPGSVYLYQGEELGLPEVIDLPDETRQDPQWHRSGGTELGRDGCRVPIPWSGDTPPFGFGPGGSWLPVPASWHALTVENQLKDPDSMLSLYRRVLRIRRLHPAFGDRASTTLEWLPSPAGVLAFKRPSTTSAIGPAGTRPTLVCAVNFGTIPVPVPDGCGDLVCASRPLDGGGGLPPDTAAWWSAG